MAEAPNPTWRLIPSRFPPIGAFDTVATAADLAAVMELEGWTNDRLVSDRIERLPREEWAFNVPNASVIMAAFLHAAPAGTRFAGAELGAWYASATPITAIAEVGHHLRREAAARDVVEVERVFRAYTATITGHGYVDLRGLQAVRGDLYAPDDYSASQAFGDDVRASGGDGIVYDSVRHVGGQNVVAFRPRLVTRVTQETHWRIRVPRVGQIEARRIDGAAR
jgi:hypothetical protein